MINPNTTYVSVSTIKCETYKRYLSYIARLTRKHNE